MGWMIPDEQPHGLAEGQDKGPAEDQPGLADGLHRKAPLSRGGKRSRVGSGGWLVAEGAAGLAKEDVVKAGSVQGDGLG